MKRRDFLKYSTTLSAGGMLLNQLPLKAFATESMLPLLNCPTFEDRVLVILFLNGGNDGLNTIIPISQYGTYIGLRPNIGLAATGSNSIVTLDSTLASEFQTGIHPAIENSFKAMYEAGIANVINGVGYPDPNRSHFSSTDLWLTGGDGVSGNGTAGWMGNLLDAIYPGLFGSPTVENPDPLGIQLGASKLSRGYYNRHNNYIASNLVKDSSTGLYGSVQGLGTAGHTQVPGSEYGGLISHIMAIENSTNVYAERISEVFNAGSNSSAAYPDEDLGNQFKTIARLLAGGCMTKVFLANEGGFDTHAAQVESGAPHTGDHAQRIAKVFECIKAFHQDLNNLGLGDKVVTLTFSEFGRRVHENGSFGTDHGSLAPLFVFGNAVQAGVVGTHFNIGNIDDGGKIDTATEMRFDYRSVFRTALQDWLGISDGSIQSTSFHNYAKIPNIIKSGSIIDPSCYSDAFIQQIQLDINLMLEGFYDPSSESMHTDLADKGLVPLNQPYSAAPHSYSGTESVEFLPSGIVDWVLIELRDATDPSIIVTRQAALLRNDGAVIDPENGTTGLVFKTVSPGSYHVAVYHRNHIAVITANPVNSVTQPMIDFTTGQDTVQGTNQLVESNGVFMLTAGDFSGDGTNDISDYNQWKANGADVNQYQPEDGDGNGVVNNKDYNLWKRNENKSGNNLIQL